MKFNDGEDMSSDDVGLTHCANSIPLRVRYQTIYDSHQSYNGCDITRTIYPFCIWREGVMEENYIVMRGHSMICNAEGLRIDRSRRVL